MQIGLLGLYLVNISLLLPLCGLCLGALHYLTDTDTTGSSAAGAQWFAARIGLASGV